LSELKDLEKLQSKRAELEAESRSLREEHKKLEYSIKVLEEQVVIEELSENNKSAKDAITQLEAKLNDLQKRLKQPSQAPQTSPNPAPSPPPQETTTKVEVAAPPEEKEAPPEPDEITLEESEDSGVTVTAIDEEALVETQEARGDKQQEKKKHRFF
jgi:hypothetical protein